MLVVGRASMLPRSLSAAAQSCASKPRLAPLLFACFAIQSPPRFLQFRGIRIARRLFLLLDRLRRDHGPAVLVLHPRGLPAGSSSGPQDNPPPTFRPAALRRRHRLRDQRRIVAVCDSSNHLRASRPVEQERRNIVSMSVAARTFSARSRHGLRRLSCTDSSDLVRADHARIAKTP